jgi:putative 4-mercaptohistidine N1-methyltranferase
VVGLDFSARFIAAAVALQQASIKRYVVKDEGEPVSHKEIRLAQLGLEAVAERCQFMQGDACNLNEKYSGYDLIFTGNLIDRRYSPKQFLCMVHERMNPGGLLILSSPYTWLEEYTKREEWLGGYKDSSGETSPR